MTRSLTSAQWRVIAWAAIAVGAFMLPWSAGTVLIVVGIASLAIKPWEKP